MLLGLDGLDPFEIRLITSKFELIAFFLYSARALRALALKSGAQVDDIELTPNSADTEFPVSSGHVSAMEGILCWGHELFTLVFTVLQKSTKSSLCASSA